MNTNSVYLDHAAPSPHGPGRGNPPFRTAAKSSRQYSLPSPQRRGRCLDLREEPQRPGPETGSEGGGNRIYLRRDGVQHLALQGIFGPSPSGKHLIISSIEHPSVAATAAALESRGASITRLPVDGFGSVDTSALERSFRPETTLVSVMHVNNEVGTVQDIRAIGNLCRARDIPFHCDASQSFGKIEVDVSRDRIDLLTVSAHKLQGPRGIGALFIRKGVKLHPVTFGGGHESGLRPGTVAVELVAAFAEALGRMSPDALSRIEETGSTCSAKRWRMSLAVFSTEAATSGFPPSSICLFPD
jgi:hypothetical protein